MDVSVSALRADERKAWEGLYRGYAEFYQMPMNDEILGRVWSWIFDAETRFFALAARSQDGALAGFMHYREMLSPLRGCEVGFLDDLFVDPTARGSGVVDALFEALSSEAEARGWPVVRWITADDNYRARSVYDRLAKKTHWVTYQLDIA